VPTVLLLAIATFISWYISGAELSKSIATAIAVLIIACPCALGLATPIALIVAAGKGAKLGFIIRSPRAIEKAKDMTDVVFDKTGTITTGSMKLHATGNYSNHHSAKKSSAISFSPTLRKSCIKH
jgi:P-type E1-E2 ATPase